MPESINFSILGAQEVSFKLKAVTEDVQLRGGRFALRKAAMFLAQKVKDNADSVNDPSTERSIPANVDIRWNRKHFDATGNLGFRVGIRGGAGGKAPAGSLTGNPGGDTRYWRHVEFGTSRSRAQPFMRRALADNIGEITGIFVNEFGAALTRAIKRAGK